MAGGVIQRRRRAGRRLFALPGEPAGGACGREPDPCASLPSAGLRQLAHREDRDGSSTDGRAPGAVAAIIPSGTNTAGGIVLWPSVQQVSPVHRRAISQGSLATPEGLLRAPLPIVAGQTSPTRHPPRSTPAKSGQRLVGWDRSRAGQGPTPRFRLEKPAVR